MSDPKRVKRAEREKQAEQRPKEPVKKIKYERPTKVFTKEEIRRLIDGYELVERRAFSEIPAGSLIRYFVKVENGGEHVLVFKMGGIVLENVEKQFRVKMVGSKIPTYSLAYSNIYKLYYKCSLSHQNELLRKTIKDMEKRYRELERRVRKLERRT
ncbi:hypothetical protein KDA11_06760, partial [Candidatus Saccharibacteria bacterium]|nr:hypothetical protein [Candidatus Saccharibacteria bacterium]